MNIITEMRKQSESSDITKMKQSLLKEINKLRKALRSNDIDSLTLSVAHTGVELMKMTYALDENEIERMACEMVENESRKVVSM